MVKIMVDSACLFAEFYYLGCERYYCELWSDNGKAVEVFHPTSGDRMMFAKIAREFLHTIPEKRWIEDDARSMGEQILFTYYYPCFRQSLKVYAKE